MQLSFLGQLQPCSFSCCGTKGLTPRLQVKKPHWEVARDALRASGDSQQLPVLPVVEGRGGSVKRIQGGKEKEIVRFR